MQPLAYSKNALSRPTSKLLLSRCMSRQATSSSAKNNTSRLSSSSTGRSSKKNQLHSSAKTEHSSIPLQEGGGVSASSSSSSQNIPAPSRQQLKVLFTASAIPMVGFGFMDNIVMIQAGQLIDNTIGVQLGLATMTAAAAGQVVSDVSGVVFGGSLERFLHRYRIIHASTLTAAQRSLPLCKNIAMFGAVCGVALGCGLGASCLLFMDLEARERAERALQLQAVLNDMMEAADNSDEGSLTWESCTIHLAKSAEHYSLTATNKKEDSFTKIDFLPQDKNQKTLALKAAKQGRAVMDDSASVLCMPILSKDDKKEVIAVLEFHNQKDAPHGFNAEDEKHAKIMARHISIFMDRLGSD